VVKPTPKCDFWWGVVGYDGASDAQQRAGVLRLKNAKDLRKGVMKKDNR
jgi:hypothetical protein